MVIGSGTAQCKGCGCAFGLVLGGWQSVVVVCGRRGRGSLFFEKVWTRGLHTTTLTPPPPPTQQSNKTLIINPTKTNSYEYKPENGDPDFPVAKGTLFQDLPDSYVCPICGAPKPKFESRVKVVAGFAENQRYGFGTNSMTGNQKLLIIYGAMLAAVALFLAGYALE
jgi:rubredoxin